MHCPSCGTENAPDSRFCGGCGARLEPARVAPTFKIPDDAAYPTPPPGSLSAIGHLPTPAPGSLSMPPQPQPRLASIPPTSPAPALASTPPTERLPSKPPVSVPPPSAPPPSAPPIARAAPVAPEPSMSLPAAPRRNGTLIAVVVIADLGLAAAGGALLFKGLQRPRPAAKPAQKSQAAAPPAAAAAAALIAPAPAPAAAPVIAPPAPPAPSAPSAPPPAAAPAARAPAPREAAKKAPVVTKAKRPEATPVAPLDPYAPAAPATPAAPSAELADDVDRMAAQSVGSFRSCLAQAIQAQPIHGGVRIAFLVEPDGRVDRAQAVVNTTGSDQLASCLAATIATWTFAPHPGPAASFERPFNYP